MQQKVIQLQIENLLEQEEIYWIQRGRVNWLKQGDQNTSFFHRSATARRKRNFIKSLKNDSGDLVDDQDQLMSMATSYFDQLFTTEVQEPDPAVFDKISPCITAEMNDLLTATYSRDEVRKAMFNIGDLKAPGPDGLHAIFYKRFWHIIGEDLTDEVLLAVNNKKVPEGWNDTTIVLIPKVENPESITQFRPISLCNVVYKVISKLIASRLKLLLPDIISPTQSAFIPGRLITDNVLVAYECYHAIKNKKVGKYGTCAVKLDMHKAYDRVEWCFLKKVLIRMGFDTGWIDLIMACVSSVRYQVRFNNVLSDYIHPSRGLRQGDPLSPYLFLLCAEGLTSLLKFEEDNGHLLGVKVCRGAPAVSHLLFADDSLILMRADAANASSLRRALDDYCMASGQLVSEAKSSIFFSPCTEVQVRAEVCSILNIMTEAITDKYLGLPPLVGIDRSDCFQHIVDRVCKLLSGWKEKKLSFGGKEVLLKAVIQAIPAYAMSVFKLPKQIIKGIITAMSQFWWGDDDQQKHMHWFAWWKMCVSKKQGGMGFRDLHCFNLAMLAKQCWRLIADPDSLCASVLRAKYFPSGDLLNCQLKKGSSYTWQSIWAGIQTFKRGHIWRVGDGTQINIWDDPWIPSSPTRKIMTRRGNTVYTKVSELFDPITDSWDEELLRRIFWSTDVERILHIPLARTMMGDFMSWHFTKTGTFSVRSCYYVEWEHQHGSKLRRTSAFGTSSNLPIWRTVWGLKVPAKIKIHYWRSLLGAIPCNGILANRHMQPSSQCQLCQVECESLRHAFFTCPRVQEIWSLLGLGDLISRVCTLEREGGPILETLLRDRMAKAPLLPEVDMNDLIASAVWYIWWERRQATHGETVQVPARTAQAISTLTINYTRAKKTSSRMIRHGWSKPKENFVKLNVDAAFSFDTGTGGTGAILRDDRGLFLAASNYGVPFAVDPATTEAQALRDGLLLAGQIGCNRIEVNSDCVEVIDVMKEGGNSLGPAAAIYEECTLLCRNFTEVVFSHIPREANMAAHVLASRSEGNQSTVWLDDPPDFLFHVLANDASVMQPD